MSRPLIILKFKSDIPADYRQRIIDEVKHHVDIDRIVPTSPSLYDIDYVPVDQGNWIIETKEGRVTVTCDKCRYSSNPTIFESLNYCPNCGTRMKNYDVNEVLKVEEG